MAHRHSRNTGNYNRQYQTKIDMECCDHYTHKINGRWECGIEPGVCEDQYNPGGYLSGPSHERGGIPARVGRNEMIELQGGEYIINDQTVTAVGTKFLDKLNSTATTYHPGGFNPGQLPNSMYAGGGKVPNRRNKMRRGRKPAKIKRMARGGKAKPMARGRMARGRMARGGPARKPARGRRTARRTATPMRGRSLGNTGTMRARKASPKRQSRVRRGKQMYQRGGGVRKFANGGNFSGGYTGQKGKCPNSEFHPRNTVFLETARNMSGEVKYYCCPDKFRTEACNGYDMIQNLDDLIIAKVAMPGH